MAGRIKTTIENIGDRVGGTIGTVSAVAVTNGNSFVSRAAIGNHYELAASRIAINRLLTPAVRSFAREMLADYTQIKADLNAALDQADQLTPPPEELDERRAAFVRHLQDAPEDAFDQTFVDQQVRAHEEATSLLRSYIAGGEIESLTSFAEKNLPIVERHLRRIQQIRSKGE